MANPTLVQAVRQRNYVTNGRAGWGPIRVVSSNGYYNRSFKFWQFYLTIPNEINITQPYVERKGGRGGEAI